jgi:hypothetical protein
MLTNRVFALFALIAFSMLSFLLYSDTYSKIEFNLSSQTTFVNKFLVMSNNSKHTKQASILEKNIISNNKYFYNKLASTSYSPLCPLIPPNLGERIPVNLNFSSLPAIQDELKYLKIKPGGEVIPSDCVPRYKVAIIGITIKIKFSFFCFFFL